MEKAAAALTDPCPETILELETVYEKASKRYYDEINSKTP